MWQEISVGVIVLGAVLYLSRQWLPVGKKNTGSCGGCGSCDTAKSCRNPDEKGTH
jgi:FeoB-associated Cys-rich membrane protein